MQFKVNASAREYRNHMGYSASLLGIILKFVRLNYCFESDQKIQQISLLNKGIVHHSNQVHHQVIIINSLHIFLNIKYKRTTKHPRVHKVFNKSIEEKHLRLIKMAARILYFTQLNSNLSISLYPFPTSIQCA